MLSRNLIQATWLICSLLLVSCNKDKKKDEDPTPDAPVIRLLVNGEDAPAALNVEVGDTIGLSATVTAEAIIRAFSGTYELDDQTIEWDRFNGDSATTSYEMEPADFYIDHTLAEKEINFLFTVSDSLDRHDSVTLVIMVNPSPITFRDSVKLGAYGHFTLGNFYNIAEGKAYFPSNLLSSTDKQNGVDFIVSYNNETKMTVMSVDSPEAPGIWDAELTSQWPFTTLTSTRFRRLNSVSFEEVVTAAQLDALFTSDGASSVATLLTGEVIAFKLDRTKNGKIGIFEVLGITGHTDDKRTLYLNLKVQN